MLPLAKQKSSEPSREELEEINAIAKVLGRQHNEELTRSELDKLVLEKVGLHVSDSVMAHIFQECDQDNSGTVSIEEFASYLKDIEDTTTKRENIQYVTLRLIFSVDWWAFLMFLAALLTSVTLNIYSRVGILPSDFNFYGMNALLYVFGCYAYVALVYNRICNEYALIELVREKIITWAESLDDERGLNSSKDMTPHEFFTLLESQGLYLPYDIFFKVFNKIDIDKGGTLSLDEIKQYAEKERSRGPLTRVQFHGKVLKTCYLSLDYWVNWGWVLGSILFAVTAFSDGLSDDAALHINGAGCFIFLFSALFQHVTNYKGTARFVDRAEELNAVFVSMVKEQSMRSSLQGRTGGRSTKGFVLKVTAEANQDAKIAEACHQIFARFDIGGADDGGDGNLDFIELYDALSQFGIVIELNVLKFIFNQADVNGDKTLQPEEFVEYIFSIKKGKTPFERRKQIVGLMAKTTFFWMVWLQVWAGITICLVNYVDFSPETARNWSLAGNFSWMIPVIWYLYTIVTGHATYFESVSRSKTKLKQSFSSATSKAKRTVAADDVTNASVLMSARVLYQGIMPE